MAYQIQLTSRAARQLKDLPREVQESISVTIDALVHNPRPDGVRKMKGHRNLYRVKAGASRSFRVIYEVQDQLLLVRVVEVGDRKYIYRNF